ncbi:LAMI_0D00364g1_1 [Lachancea mirantina]|uniref:LAMI_0D00364g1_1 n=1 Tax=Lachancea mirantina TaxID=1230905 RepID=A0A1G4J817_9SACH|nr:LAMI_0D00364g1_1 [Lachancea mirantina]
MTGRSLRVRIREYFGNPGCRPDVNHKAPICAGGIFLHHGDADSKSEQKEEVNTVSSDSDQSSFDNVELGLSNGKVWTKLNYTGLKKDSFDKGLDRLVDFAGSQLVFFFMWIILIVWIIVGIIYKAPDNWQIVMQDGQSIQSYFWDTLLMRQQLNSSHEHVWICANIRSRLKTIKRFCTTEDRKGNKSTACQVKRSDISAALPVESWYDRVCSKAGEIIGSLPVMIVFWLGIFTWVGCGAVPTATGNKPPYSASNPKMAKFSDEWQLYVNTSTAVIILVCCVFLQNTRARHDRFIAKFILEISRMDQAIERHLRTYFCDFETDNPNVCIPTHKRNNLTKCIDWYADVIGTGIGVCIAVGVIAVWIAIGKPMSWNGNWWLIIGTYTGLVGFLDGFVLRQVYFKIVVHEESNYATVAEEDYGLFQILGIELPDDCIANIDSFAPLKSITYRISCKINSICSSEWSVLVSVVMIISLIVIASCLHWSETGQLICNTPTMIIEAFFLIVLLQAHNWADKKRRLQVSALYARRVALLSYVEESYSLSR